MLRSTSFCTRCAMRSNPGHAPSEDPEGRTFVATVERSECGRHSALPSGRRIVIRGKLTSTFVRWSEHVPASDVQDPLGLELRGSARLASRLLFCITSITPRARYYSFIPWCVLDWQKREKDQPGRLGLEQAIILREKALTFGAVAHHEGKPCVGGGLVGSTSAQKWLSKGLKALELKKVPFAQAPARDAYFNSLVNLGVFKETNQHVEVDDDAEVVTASWNDLELSPLGTQLAGAYDTATGHLQCVRDTAAPQRKTSLHAVKEFGRLGGLCELMAAAPDREVLRDMFLARTGEVDRSHAVRRQSLLLLIELIRQLSADGWSISEGLFSQSVYFGQCQSEEDDRIDIAWPAQLADIAARWRMFYFHQHMSIALEGLFAWVVTHVAGTGVTGVSFGEMVSQLNAPLTRKNLSQVLKRTIRSPFGDSTPVDTIRLVDDAFDGLDGASSRRLDTAIPLGSPFSEDRLGDVIREGTYLRDSAGLAIPMVLLTVTLARYTQWEETNYGQWLAQAARDPYLDLLPPVLTDGLRRHFGPWWTVPWADFTEHVLRRYVVQQHQSLSYEKTLGGDRCLLQVDGVRVMSNAAFDTIGVKNPRFRSALQVLKDLALIEERDDEVTRVTKDGRRTLKELLAETDAQ